MPGHGWRLRRRLNPRRSANRVSSPRGCPRRTQGWNQPGWWCLSPQSHSRAPAALPRELGFRRSCRPCP